MTTDVIKKNMLRFAAACFAVLLLCGVFCGAATAETHTHDGITFELWNNGRLLPNTAGSYYLMEDITLHDDTWTVPSGTINLCLNGHSIQKSSEYDSIIMVGSGTTLNLYDCKNSGRITCENVQNRGNGVFVQGGTFTMYNGSITENTAGQNGGGVYVCEGGTFTMYGGSITKNTAGQNGGGVYVCGSSTFTMYGGSITKNEATRDGGGVYVNGGNFTMSNEASITENHAMFGGGVYVKSGEFTMSGGSIIGNIVENAFGGVYVEDGMLSVSDAPVIKDNTDNKNFAENVCLMSGLITVTGPLTVDADIRIYSPWEGNFAQGTDTYTVTIYDAMSFLSDDGWSLIKVIENKLCLINKEETTTTAVTFKDGGSTPEEIIYTRGQVFQLPEAPQKTGDTFLGWKVESTGEYFCLYHQTMGYQYLSPSPYYSSDRKWGYSSVYIPALTLTAVWASAGLEPIPRPVTYNVLTAPADTTMGTVSGAPTSPIASGTQVTLNAEPKNGCLFKKWATIGFTPTDATKSELTFTMPAQDIAAVAIFEKILIIDDSDSGGSGVNTPDNIIDPDENGKVKIESETFKEKPEAPTIKMMEVNSASSSVSFKGTSDVNNPTESISGFNEPTVFAKFEIESEDKNINFVIDVEKNEGINPQYVFLRHFNISANKWDNGHIAGKQLSGAPEGFFRLEFPITSCSPFAVVYETPVSNPQSSHSSRDYGTSIWLTATPTPTPIVEATAEPTQAQPTTSPIKPVQTPASPVPLAGIIAGLGAVGVLFGLRRK